MKILFIVATMCLFGLNTYAASYDEVYNQVFFLMDNNVLKKLKIVLQENQEIILI